jgi:hypothetical protein
LTRAEPPVSLRLSFVNVTTPPALSQQVLDIAEAEGEPGIKPDGLLNDYGWEAISGVADLCHGGHLRPQITGDKPNNMTMPLPASGLIDFREIDGRQTLAARPIDQPIDHAA